ncbi:AppA family phytase/histidine-type acid phosphatase [Citrobacter sp. C348]|uniref:AppA family phytase/histidine-type acid phosphatase n=1 Tax=Citrobacter sp. C348 TaxID=3048143 RepID=UPI0015EA45DE|nr:AppA family phytase/histidine-type acid phosphatase [Citrobacter freundii]QMD25290.1 AppA family phytase/histidine-type acid phosphatase [Citrobacter freundii]WFW15226.1 AppA family phytase/histidine-type acid phosphatase [Citrobacter freundii]
MSIFIIRLLFFSLLCGSFSIGAEEQNGMKLERVVIVSRHGVRAPTKFTPIMKNVTPYQWPQWDVPLGWLTPRGGELVSELGQYQRLWFASKGLLNNQTCPPTGQVAVIADTDQRTRKTGEAFLAGLAPKCQIQVHYQKDDEKTDPLFNPVKMGKCSFDTLKVKKAILERAGGNIELYTLRYQPSFRTLETVLNFSQSEICKTTETSEKCTLPGALPSELKVTPDSVSLPGAWGLSSTLTEIFLLQEAQGIPQVAWGRITGDKEWKELLSLHNAQFDLLQRTPAVARTRATPLLDLINTALVKNDQTDLNYGIKLPVSLLFIAGHDTNLANISGALGLTWSLPGQPDNTPPGGELVFERWNRASDNTDWVKVSFVYQTLKSMRDRQHFSLKNPPGKVDVEIAACDEKNMQGMCSIKSFSRLIEDIRVPECAVAE